MWKNSIQRMPLFITYQLTRIPMHNKLILICQQSIKGIFLAHSSNDRFELGLTPIDLSLFDKEFKIYPNRESAEELRNGFKYMVAILNVNGHVKLVFNKM